MTVPKPGPPPRKDCPHPHKLAWPTQKLAEAGMIRGLGLFVTRGYLGNHIPKRVYPCRCGWWHMTSKPKREATNGEMVHE